MRESLARFVRRNATFLSFRHLLLPREQSERQWLQMKERKGLLLLVRNDAQRIRKCRKRQV